MAMPINKRIIIGVVIVAILIGGAFLTESLLKVYGGKTGLTVEVKHNSTIASYLDAGVIRSLAVQEGLSVSKQEVSLRYVITSVGINSYDGLTIGGLSDNTETQVALGQDIADKAFKANGATISLINSKTGEALLDAVTKISVTG